EGIVDAVEKGLGVLAAARLPLELADAAGEADVTDRRNRFRGDVVAQPLVELPGLFQARLGQDDGELVASVPGGDVRLPEHLAHPVGDAGERGVSGEMALEAIVDLLEVVEVEHDERQLAVVAVRPRYLALECLLEVARVVESGARVQVGEATSLAVAAGIV